MHNADLPARAVAQQIHLAVVNSRTARKPDQKSRVVPRGANLLIEGDEAHSIILVQSGWLAASKSLPEGQRQIVEVILPGEIYDPVAADGNTSFVTLEALCDAKVMVIDRNIWARLLDDLPDLQRFAQCMAHAERTRQSERILRLGKASAETRIAYAMIELCIRMTAIGAVAKGGSFHVPLNQQQLSEITGLSSVHVCRTLRRLNRQGLITTDDHMDIKIHDSAMLADLAGVDLHTLRQAIIPAVA